MTAREKLARLLCKAHNAVTEAELENDDMSYADALEIEADVLIANGVVISKIETTTQKWIPVSERLPEESDADDDNCVLAIHKATKKRYFHWRSVADNPFDFTHWMPLPTPPKEE